MQLDALSWLMEQVRLNIKNWRRSSAWKVLTCWKFSTLNLAKFNTQKWKHVLCFKSSQKALSKGLDTKGAKNIKKAQKMRKIQKMKEKVKKDHLKNDGVSSPSLKLLPSFNPLIYATFSSSLIYYIFTAHTCWTE